jgi:hypothetical protein
MGWTTFWAIFSQTHLVALAGNGPFFSLSVHISSESKPRAEYQLTFHVAIVSAVR